MFLIRLGIIQRQANGQAGRNLSKRPKDGAQEEHLLLVRRMEHEIPAQVQVAPPDLTPGPLATYKKVAAENVAVTVEKDRVVLLREHLQEQTDAEDNREEDAKGKAAQDYRQGEEL